MNKMHSFRHCCNAAILVLLLLLGLVSSAPQLEVGRCIDETGELFSDSISVFRKTEAIAKWAEDLQRNTPEAICTAHSVKKTTCTLDYTNATSSTDWCLGVPESLYLETEFIYRCTNSNNAGQIVYSVMNRPACYAYQENSFCYDGYDQSVLETIELATFDDMKVELQRPTSTDNHWGDLGNFEECTQVRFQITVPIISKVRTDGGINKECTEATEQIHSSDALSSALLALEAQVLGLDPNSTSSNAAPTNGEDINYGSIAHSINSICNDDMNGIYLELTYTVSCDFDSENFLVSLEPFCLSKTFCGKFDYESQSLLYISSNWPGCDIVNTTTSTGISRMIDWEDFSPSANPTVSFSPSTSTAPSLTPTVSLVPSVSLAPTEEFSLVLSCKEDSMDLVSVGTSVETQNLRNGDQESRNDIAAGLTAIQDLMDINVDTGKGFEQYCKTVASESGDGITALCEFNYDDAIETKGGEEDASIAMLCRNANGVYVEESVSIICTPTADENAGTTRLIVQNKPSCRSKYCNVDEIQDLATTQFDRWMKISLENGLEEAFADASDADGKTAPILSGTQSCVMDSDEEEEGKEGASIIVGGSSLFSNDGEGDPVEPTEDCSSFTGAVNGNIQLYNQKTVAHREFADYVDTDLRQLCFSPKQNELECDFDWVEVLSASVNDGDDSPGTSAVFKSSCMPSTYGKLNPGASGSYDAGQYVESTFLTSCVKDEEKKLTMTNRNVPGCVGTPCTPGQAQYILNEDSDFISQPFIDDGWSCSTDTLSVYAAHYDPFVGTYDLADVIQNPQFDEVVKDDGVGVGPTKPDSNDISTDAPKEPTATPMVLPSPKYGSIYDTGAPTALASSQPPSSIIWARIKIISLLPIILSVLII